MSDSDPTKAALGQVLARFVALCRERTGGLPVQVHDPRWPSPCQVGGPSMDGTIRWQPVERGAAASFDGVERALETAIHPSIKAFYGSFWCDSFEAETADGGLTLIQVWNDADFDRLCENILGHAFAKQRIKAPLTVFFACTDEDELMLSVDNTSGRVVLENPGQHPLRDVADSLPAFLAQVTPVYRPP